MALSRDPFLLAPATQTSSEREVSPDSPPCSTSENTRQQMRGLEDEVDCPTVLQNIVDPHLDYLEDWQNNHARETAKAGAGLPVAARAPDIESAEPRQCGDSPSKSFRPASGTNPNDRLLLTCNRTLSPASEGESPPIAKSGTALPQASPSSRRSVKRIRHSPGSRRLFACSPVKRESAAGAVVAAGDMRHRDAIQDLFPELASSSLECSPVASSVRQREEKSERGRDLVEWKEAQKGWPTVWRCPKTPLYALLRILLGLLFLTCCAYSMCILSVVSDQFYDPEKGPARLHDRLHDQVLSAKPLWLASPILVDVMTVGLLLVTAVRHTFFIPYSIGFLVLYRFFFLLGFLYVLRGIAIVITTVPPSKKHCEPPRIRQATDLFRFSLQQCLSLRTECTGMIISGHSVTTCCSLAIWLLYGDAPAVSPLQNIRAACANVSAAIRAYWAKRHKIVPLDDTSEIIDSNRNTEDHKAKQPLPPSRKVDEEEEEGRTIAAGKGSSASVAVGVPSISVHIPPSLTDSSQIQQVVIAEERRFQTGTTAEVDDATSWGAEQQNGKAKRREIVAHGRDVLQVVGERSWEQQQYQGEGKDGSSIKGGVSQGNQNNDEEVQKQQKSKAQKSKRWKRNNAGDRSSWSTAADADERITRTNGDTAPAWLNVSDSVDKPPKNTMVTVLPAESQQENSPGLETERTQQLPLLEQEASSRCWQRLCGWFTWQRVRRMLWTPSLLRLVCLVIGSVNLLFIVFSFNHYTIDVFMAINFTLGGWSFYHFVVALLWDERLAKEYFSPSSSACTATVATKAGAARCQQQHLQRKQAAAGVSEKMEKEEIEEMETRDVTDSSERDAVAEVGQVEEEERTSFRCNAGARLFRFQKKVQSVRAAAEDVRQSNSNTSSACHRCNGESGDTSARRRAGGEISDTLSDTSPRTATPDKQMLPVLLHDLEEQGKQGCNSSKARGCSSTAPASGDDKINSDASEEWLFDMKATTSYESLHSPAQGDCSGREASSHVGRGGIPESAETRDECSTQRRPPCYNNHPEHTSTARPSCGGTELWERKDNENSRARLVRKLCGHLRRAAASSRSSSISTCLTDENNTSANAAASAAACSSVRGSWKTLHLPLLQPAIYAVRRLEGL